MKRLSFWLSAGLLTAGSLLFFSPVLFSAEDGMLFGYDLQWLFHPAWAFARDTWRAGEFPLWNPSLFLGFPHYAEPQLSTFYPPLWAAVWWAGLDLAPAWLVAGHTALAAVGACYLVRSLGGRAGGALLAGIAFGFAPLLLARIPAGHLPHVMTIAWLPWLLAGAERAVARRSWGAAAAAGLPLGLAMLAGYAPFFLQLVMGVTLFMAWRAWSALRTDGRRAAGMIAAQWVVLGTAAGLLAAVQLLPALEFARLSSRAVRADYAFAGDLSLPFHALVRLLMPDVYGAVNGAGVWHDVEPLYAWWEYAVYPGVLPLALFLIAATIGVRGWRFWWLLGLGGLVLALGPEGVAHRLLYQTAPGFGLFRVPARMMIFFTLATAVVGGLAFDRWFELDAGRRDAAAAGLRRALWVLTAVVGAAILFAVVLQATADTGQAATRLAQLIGELVRFALLAGATLLLLQAMGRFRSYWTAVALAAAVLVIDLWGHGQQFLVQDQDGPDPAWIMADLALPGERDAYRVLAAALGNEGYLYDFRTVNGYDDFRTETGHTLGNLALEDARIAGMLGARYLLRLPHEAGEPAPGWELLTAPAGVLIDALETALPRVFVVHQVVEAADARQALALIRDPATDLARSAVLTRLPGTSCPVSPHNGKPAVAEIVAETANRVVVRADLAADGLLVLTDLAWPGWSATADGQSVPVQIVNYGLRGVCLSAGQHEVTFAFRPPLFRLGGALTLVGVVWQAAVLATPALRRRKAEPQ